MEYKILGRTGLTVSVAGLGCGGPSRLGLSGLKGQTHSESEVVAHVRCAIDLGINFFDTADVYGDGHSERLIAKLRKERKEQFTVATKAGRRLSPHEASGYNLAKLTEFVDRSRKNLEMDCLDLVQLHCPPTDVYYQPKTFDALDELKAQGKIRHYGVSVERVEEGLKSLEYPGVQSIQIILNVFRQRPLETLLAKAAERRVGIIARVPLASGLLSGKLQAGQSFEADDHRNFNRHGEAFDQGETFSGVDYDLALSVVDSLRSLVPADASMAQWAIRWILMHPAVTCSIPGARRPAQVEENMAAADLPPMSDEVIAKVAQIYHERIRQSVNQRW